MILLADIGNSTIKLGLAAGGKIKKVSRLDGVKGKSSAFFESRLRAYFAKMRIKAKNIDVACFCSVAPSANNAFGKAVRKVAGCTVLIAGIDMPIAIKNMYKKPAEVGVDRLINAVAVYDRYPDRCSIVVDFGTAVTIDVVNSKGEYSGGLILPGLQSSLQALAEAAELLPVTKLAAPKGFIGKDTATSLKNGLFYGALYACEGIIEKLKDGREKEVTVVATGGYAGLFKTKSKHIDVVDLNLTLYGLYLNLKKNGII